MKTILLSSFGAPTEVARLVDHDPGPLAEGDALVEVLATPINPSDVLTLQGLYGQLPKLPAIPGSEGIGRIVELSGPSSLSVGQRVFLPFGGGTWRTHLKAPAARLQPAPDGDPLQLSMLGVNPPTAALLLREFVDLAPGDWVLQNAANSAVGRYVIELARRAGVRTVNVVRRAELEPELTALGADVVLVDGDDLARRVRKATGGAPVRLSFDAVGGAASQRLGDATAPGGTLVVYGLMGGMAPQVSGAALVFRDVRVRGFWLVRSLQAMDATARTALYGELAGLVAGGTLQARVDATFPLERIDEALRRAMQEGRSGKVVLTPNG